MKSLDIIPTLKPHLKEYLRTKIGNDIDKKFFKCYVHDEDSPSMSFVPNTDETIVHCFGCSAHHDIFNAAGHWENLPQNGAEWLTVTIPKLCEYFKIPYEQQNLDPALKEALKLKKFFNDLSNIISNYPESDLLTDFLSERELNNEYIQTFNIPVKYLTEELQKIGWESNYIKEQLSVGEIDSDKKMYIVGSDYISFLIKDKFTTPVGIVSRNMKNTDPKYINSQDSVIYKKKEILFGFDVALKNKNKDMLYIVEGPGDLLALHTIGITNAVALCGTAFSKQQVQMIKLSGYRGICFALDNDDAGQRAIRKHIYDLAESLIGLSVSILIYPDDNYENDINDIIKQLVKSATSNVLDTSFMTNTISSIDYLINIHESKDSSVDIIVKDIIQFIILEPTATRREFLADILSKHTGISLASILDDIEYIRKNKNKERQQKIKTSVEQYLSTVQQEPDNAPMALSLHQQDLQSIESEYKKTIIGATYQVARFDALEDDVEAASQDKNSFSLKKMACFANALNDGSSWARDTTVLLGGRPNSGKTLIAWEVGMDALIHDENTIVVVHMTDDSYFRMLPRAKTLISQYIRSEEDPVLTIGMASNPTQRLITSAEKSIYQRSKNALRSYLKDGKLYLLDNEDGPYLSVLDKQLKYIRSFNPDSKIMIIADGAHNYRDFGDKKDQNEKMKAIAEAQMDIVIRNKAFMLCTAEYRKNLTINPKEIKWPVDDDIADSRALTYRCQAVTHVYNDMNDRAENATIFYSQNKIKKPRLIYYFGKNKISSFKDKMAFDIDTRTVTLTPIDIAQARADEETAKEKEKRHE